MFWKLFVWLGLGVFVLLSAADWVFTFALLRTHPSAIEANPLAAACLEQHGWTGLAVYKAAGVLALVLSVVVIVRRRPTVAAGVVAFGCAALLSVTTYSHQLLCEMNREARAIRETEYPKDKSTNDNESLIPERCWFADDPQSAKKPDVPMASARPLIR